MALSKVQDEMREILDILLSQRRGGSTNAMICMSSETQNLTHNSIKPIQFLIGHTGNSVTN